MVGCTTIAHGIAQRLSEKWRHCSCTSFVITFCTSSPFLCWRDSPNPRHNNRPIHPLDRTNERARPTTADRSTMIGDLRRATNDERRAPTGARGLSGTAPAFFGGGKNSPRTPQQAVAACSVRARATYTCNARVRARFQIFSPMAVRTARGSCLLDACA